MRNRRFELSSIDMASFLIISIFGVRLLTLPRDLSAHMYTATWVSVFLGGVLAMIIGFMMYWIGMKYPGKNGSEIVILIFGKYIGAVGIILIGLHILGSAGLELRLFGDTINLYLLPSTPFLGIVIIMITSSYYAYSNGLKSITSLVNILLPQVLFFTGILLMLPLTIVDKSNFLNPLGMGVMPIIEHSIISFDALYGFGILPYILPYFKEPKSTKKWILVGIGIPTILYTAVVLLCVLAFGVEEMRWMLYPTVTLVKSIRLKYQLFERAESFLITVWVIIVFMSLIIAFYINDLNFKALLKPKQNSIKDKMIRYGQVIVVGFIIMLPKDVTQQKIYDHYIHFLGRFLFLGLIPLMAVITFFKERKKKHEK